MCTAVDSIHDIASGQYQQPGHVARGDDTEEDTLLQLLTRVRQCLSRDSKCLADGDVKQEIEQKVLQNIFMSSNIHGQ